MNVRLRQRLQTLRVAGTALVLSVLLSFPSSAAYVRNSGDLQPATYLFDLFLNTRGIGLEREVDLWFDAYVCYVTKHGSSGARSRLNALKNLTWGQTYPQMDLLASDIGAWLKACTFSGVHLYSPMDAPAPLEWPTADETFSVQTTPYPLYDYEKNPIVASGDYQYLFSYMRTGSDGTIYKCNCSIPKGTDFFGVVTGCWSYKNLSYITFYKKDRSSAGYSECPVYTVAEWYDPVTHTRKGGNGGKYYGIDAGIGIGQQQVLSLPFPVGMFSASYYLKGGADSQVRNGFCPVLSSHYPLKSIFSEDFQVDSMSSSVALPASSAAGKTILASIAAASTADTRKTLQSEAGLTLTWRPLPYRIEYYYDGILQEQQELSVSPDENTVQEVPPLEKNGYRLTDSPYAPALPANITRTDNTISVSYESWEYPYTVNYYYGSTLRDSVSLSVPSYANTVSEVPLLTDSSVYQLRDSPYSPALPAEINDETNVIDVYYSSPVSDSVSSGFGSIAESLKAFLLSALPYALGILCGIFLLFFLVRFYKRTVDKS